MKPWAYAAALALVLALAITAGPHRARAVQWDETYFPNTPLVTHEGETVRFYDDLIKDRIVVFNFFYTECPDMCGLSTARLAQVADWLGDRIGRDIFIYSISLDPSTDTPERLREYAAAFGAREGWVFLTGAPQDVDVVRYKLGERSRSLGEHRSDMVLGNDKTGEWRRTSLMGSLGQAAQDILQMDPAWIPPRPTADSVTASSRSYAMSGTMGEALYLRACAACHTIGEGDLIGPDLAGVTLRRDRDWLTRYLRSPDAVRAGGDPVAAALTARYKGARMPDLGLGATDADDVLRYIDEQMAKIDGAGEDEALTAHNHGPLGASLHDHAE